MAEPPVSPAELAWDGATPHSTRFDDVYFSRAGGLAETQHVFLSGNGLPHRWSGRQRFVIAETGFGTGLNFLTTWQAWRQHAPPAARLFYLSVERYPLCRDDLARALSAWPELAELSAELLRDWPVLEPGLHPLCFDGGRVRLLLLFGDAGVMLRQLRARVEAWYLDGFAPARNPELWTEPLFREIARLSVPGATFATFTAAGQVRRGLAAAGFRVEKVPGFGRKREMLRGQIAAPPVVESAPWFAVPSVPDVRQVVVIGAGLAGAGVAWALAQRGCAVTVIERHAAPAQEASGNPAGVLLPLAEAAASPRQRWFAAGYRYTRRQLARLTEVEWSPCGVLLAAWNEREQRRYADLLARLQPPAEVLRAVTAAEAADLCGLPTAWAGLYVPDGGWVNPPSLCRALLAGVRTLWSAEVLTLARDADGWRVLAADGGELAQAEAVVIAGGRDAARFAQTAALPLALSRGQLTEVAATADSQALRAVVCGSAYVLPARAGWHGVGATYAPLLETTVTAADHARNRAALAAFWPQLAARLPAEPLRGRAALRAAGPDHLPLVGPVPQRAAFLAAFKDLRRGFPPSHYPPAPCWPGLYISAGHGSRGLSSALLAGELLAAQMLDEPWPVARDVAEALHPGRFWVRELCRFPPDKGG